jgi:hypothetical protein
MIFRNKIKKAQLQMGETIFVVIFIIILIVFGIVFSTNAEEDSIREKQKTLTDLNAITISKYASSLIELQCSTLGVIDKSCFDKYKLMAFMNLSEKESGQIAEYYFSQFKNANVTIKEIYPPTNNEWTIYYNELGFNKTKKSKMTTIPVSLLDPISKQKSFGELIITTFS